MRFLLSLNSRQKLFDSLIKKHNCKFLKELSKKMNIPLKTIQNWRYCQERYIPSKIIPSEIEKNLEDTVKSELN